MYRCVCVSACVPCIDVCVCARVQVFGCGGGSEYVTACMCHSDVCVQVCQNEINFGYVCSCCQNEIKFGYVCPL